MSLDSQDRRELEGLFKYADTDNDGFINLIEALESAANRDINPRIRKNLTTSLLGGDTNKDRQLSLEEFLSYMENAYLV